MKYLLANLNCSVIMLLICVYAKVDLPKRTSKENNPYLYCTITDDANVLYVEHFHAVDHIHCINCCTEFSIFIVQVINPKEQQLNSNLSLNSNSLNKILNKRDNGLGKN